MTVTLGDVTVDNWAGVVGLELDEHQSAWIAPNHVSLL